MDTAEMTESQQPQTLESRPDAPPDRKGLIAQIAILVVLVGGVVVLSRFGSDQQVDPAVARWLTAAGGQASRIADPGLRDEAEQAVTTARLRAGAIGRADAMAPAYDAQRRLPAPDLPATAPADLPNLAVMGAEAAAIAEPVQRAVAIRSLAALHARFTDGSQLDAWAQNLKGPIAQTFAYLGAAEGRIARLEQQARDASPPSTTTEPGSQP